jgi:hypothetical protein
VFSPSIQPDAEDHRLGTCGLPKAGSCVVIRMLAVNA